MDLADLIIKTSEAKTAEEKKKLREEYNAEVRRKNKEFFDDFYSKIA